MSLIPWMMAYRHRKMQESARNRARMRSRNRSQDKNQSKIDLYERDDSRVLEYSRIYGYASELKHCLSAAIKADEKVAEIFKKLVEGAQTRYDKAQLELEKEVLSLVAPSEKLCDKYYYLFREIEKLGFSITSDKIDNNYFNRLVVARYNKGGYAYDKLSKPLFISGVRLTKEIVASGDNPYKIKRESFKQKNPDFEKYYEAVKAEYMKLKRNKIMLKLSQKRRERLRKSEARFEVANKIYLSQLDLEEKAKLYSSLTEEQKQMLLKFFIVTNALESMSEKIEKLHHGSLLQIGHYNENNDEEKKEYDEFITGIIDSAEKTLSEEEVEYFDSFLQKFAHVINKAIENNEVDKLPYDFDHGVNTQAGNEVINSICGAVVTLNAEIEKNKHSKKEDETIKS